jgi:hypothetical protein
MNTLERILLIAELQNLKKGQTLSGEDYAKWNKEIDEMIDAQLQKLKESLGD